jgi:hypothetical protein
MFFGDFQRGKTMKTVEDLINELQKLPRDFEVWTATYQNFYKPNQSKEIIEIIAEMGSESVILISK